MREQTPSPRLSSRRSQREASTSSCPAVCEESSHRLVQGNNVQCAMLSVSPSAHVTSDGSSSFQVRFHDTESTLANVAGLFSHTCFSYFYFCFLCPSSSVHCRHGCAVAKADKTVVQVMQQLQVRGQCSLCCQLFFSPAQITSHEGSTGHVVEINDTMQKAVLQHCRFRETRPTGREREAQKRGQPGGRESPSQKRTKRWNPYEVCSAEERKPGLSENGAAAVGWRCECGLRFSEEAAARKHLFAANQIFHQCGVCGKHMEELPITRLHMCRFHGGAHLSNILFYCRKCKLELPRYEDVTPHVSQDHAGHTYVTELELAEELAATVDAQPSTSRASTSRVNAAPVQQERSWMCRMCEDVFDSEEAVLEHCGDASSHSFQRFACGHCPQKFFKESTVRRHCAHEHGGRMESFHFCGLCDSMHFESEGEFLEHYRQLHSRDYYCVNGDGAIGSSGQPACPCMGSEKSKEELKSTYTRCMKDLAAAGKCRYACAPCGVLASSYAQIKTHVHTKHPALNLGKSFEVACGACRESFQDVPSFHQHYHRQHCTLAPCPSSASVAVLTAVEIKPDSSGNLLSPPPLPPFAQLCVSPKCFNQICGISEIDDETLVAFLNEDQAKKDGSVLKGREE